MENKFRKELEILINRQSKESRSNTPDWILAKYLDDCLTAFENATDSRSQYHSTAKKCRNIETNQSKSPFN